MSIDNMQFGVMSGKGTTDAIFIMRQVQEKHQAKKKKLYYAFVDLVHCYLLLSLMLFPVSNNGTNNGAA